MKKFAILPFAVLAAVSLFTGYAFAQEDAEPAAGEEALYEADEDVAEPIEIEDEMMMFSEEATQEVGSMEAEYGDAEEEPADTSPDEIVTTYDADDAGLETDECTLWSCALYKMIVVVVGIGASAFWIFMLADILKLDAGTFPAGREYRKWLWFAGVFFFWAIGAAVYYFEMFRGESATGRAGKADKKV